MSQILVLTEKPSVAFDISKVINNTSIKKEGYIQGDKYIITWAIGHLVGLYEPEDYDEKYAKWILEDLPIIPEQIKLKVLPKTKKQFNIVKKLINDSNIKEIILATDSGREGEAIGRFILQLAGCKKPFKRLWISSMTDESIRKGFQNLKDGKEYDNLYLAAKSRAVADWLVGINASRAFSVKFSEKLTIGRVQTPVLALIVKRHLEINNFKPEPFWEVQSVYNQFTGTWYDTKEKTTKLFDKKRAEEIANKVTGEEGTVVDVKKEVKKQPPPLLYDLTELQRDANKYYGYSAKKTLTLAQALYEKHKLLTYPRTDSRYLTEDMKGIVSSTLKSLSLGPYAKVINPIINNLNFTNRIINNKKVSDHHAIIVTNIDPTTVELSKDEKNIYNLVLKRLIAAFYPYYEYENTIISIKCNNELFISKGKTILNLGWMQFYKSFSDNCQEEQQLPIITKGTKILFKEAIVLDKKTKPPKLYTEGSLLSAMENAGKIIENEELKEQLKDSGLGTPATRADIIEKLIKTGYILKQNKNLIPTDKGINLIKIVPKELKSAELTGKWEKALNAIAKGEFSVDKFMESIHNFTRFIINEAINKTSVINFEKKTNQDKSKKIEQTLGTCPICQKGKIFKNSKGYGCSEYVSGCKFFIGEIICQKKISSIQVKKIITSGKSDAIEGFKSKSGKDFKAVLILKNNKLEFEFK